MAIKVKLNPVRTTVNSKKNPFKAVTGAKLQLELPPASRQPTKATTTPQSAKIVFFGSGTHEPFTFLGLILGEIAIQKKIPVFDAKSDFMRGRIQPSDFVLDLEFDAQTFKNTDSIKFLYLPWIFSGEGDKFTVGTRLALTTPVDGTESNVPENDVLDVPLKHLAVPEDGVSKTNFFDCFGVRTVYPLHNEHLTAQQRIPLGNDPLRVFLHDSVRGACNRTLKDSFDLNAITAKIRTVMESGGITNVQVQEVDNAGAAVHWARRNVQGVSRFIARNIANPNDTNIPVGQEANVPFFDFWVFFEPNVAGSIEAGLSETFVKTPLNPAQRTKPLVFPIVLPGLSGQSPLLDTLKSIPQIDDFQNHIVAVITHEIGHGLGLRHGLNFENNAYSISSSFVLGTMTAVPVVNNTMKLPLFGPVHREALRRHYL